MSKLSRDACRVWPDFVWHRRAPAFTVALLAALSSAGCSGLTVAVSNVTRTSVTLNAKAACLSTCYWYFRYGTNNLYQYRTPVHVVTQNTHGQEISLPGETISGLIPGASYQYQLCGLGDDIHQFACVGDDGTPRSDATFQTTDSKSDCLYGANSVPTLVGFEQRVGYHFQCALTFANTNQQWASWEAPWFTAVWHPAGWLNWEDWKRCTNPYDPCAAGERRELIITTQLWPSSEEGSNPLAKCALGAYNEHATALAANLIADGLGDSIIRIQQEGNDTSVPGDLPADGPDGWPTVTEELEWARCWSNEALAMKSVPGAHFLMDWTINDYWRPIPLQAWYPGDGAVDIIGIDAYDAGLPASITSQPAAWTRIYTQSDGIGAVQQFAAQHGKPMSFSEWGLGYAGAPDFGLGDDPVYVADIAAVVRLVPFAYQSYFLNRDAGALLQSASGVRSFFEYAAHFGRGGDATGYPTVVP